VMNLGDLQAKWISFGWDCIVADGHNIDEIREVIDNAKKKRGDGKPKMILMKTDMGKGVDFMEGTHHWHGKAPNQDQTEKALSQLKETLGDF